MNKQLTIDNILTLRAPNIQLLLSLVDQHIAGKTDLLYYPDLHDLLTIVIIAATPEDQRKKLLKVRNFVAEGRDIMEKGLYFTSRPRGESSLAFLYPGYGSQYHGMLAPVRKILPFFDENLKSLSALWQPIIQKDIETIVYGGNGEDKYLLRHMDSLQAIMSYIQAPLLLALTRLGIKPSIIAGHSYGESTAIWHGGGLDLLNLGVLVNGGCAFMEEARRQNIGTMLSIDADLATVNDLIKDYPGEAFIAGINGPRLIVISGTHRAIGHIKNLCTKLGLLIYPLPVSAPFHSPLVVEPNRKLVDLINDGALFRDLKGRPRIVSCSKGEFFKKEKSGLIENAMTQFVAPLNWQKTMETMLASGCRLFLEVGPAQVLTKLGKRFFSANDDAIFLACDPLQKDPMQHWVDLVGTLLTHGVRPSVLLTEGARRDNPSSVVTISNASSREKSATAEVIEQYMQSNASVAREYFLHQKEVIQLMGSHGSESERAKLAASLLSRNEIIMTDIIETQRIGLQMLKRCDETAQLLPEKEDVTSIPVEKPSEQQQAEAKPERTIVTETPPAPPLAAAPSLAQQVKKWLLGIVSSWNEVPKNTIDTKTPFDDIGVDSVRILELFDELTAKFPQVAKLTFVPQTIRCIDDVLKQVADLEAQQDQTGAKQTAADEPKNASCPVSAPLSERVKTWALDTIAAWNEVPAETIDTAARFDDIGVDSVRILELFDELTAKFPEIARIAFVPQNIRCIDDLLQTITSSQKKNYSEHGPASSPKSTLRYLPRLIEITAPANERPTEIILLGCRSRMSAALGEVFSKAGIATRFVALDARGWASPDGQRIGFEDLSALTGLLTDGTAGKLLCPLVFCAADDDDDIFSTHPMLWCERLAFTATASFSLAKSITEIETAGCQIPSLMVLLKEGGDSAWHAAAGVAKALSKESAHTRVHTVTVSADAVAYAQILLPFLLGHESSHNLLLSSQAIKQWQLVPTALTADTASRTPNITLKRGDTIIATGGATGITAKIAIKLAARFGCHIAAIGRTEYPQQIFWSATHSEDQMVKILTDLHLKQHGIAPAAKQLSADLAKIRRQREILATETAVTEAGGTFSYHNADAGSVMELSAAVHNICQQYGPIKGCMHGAGFIRDLPLSKKTFADFLDLVNVKAAGAAHLMLALAHQPLQFFFVFSSLTTFVGAPGQSDYNAANAVMEELARYAQGIGSYGLAKAMAWSVWGESGLASSSLLQRMKKHGLEGIDDQSGVQTFIDELLFGDPGETSVIFSPQTTLDYALTGKLPDKESGMPVHTEGDLG